MCLPGQGMAGRLTAAEAEAQAARGAAAAATAAAEKHESDLGDLRYGMCRYGMCYDPLSGFIPGYMDPGCPICLLINPKPSPPLYFAALPTTLLKATPSPSRGS